MLRGCPNSVFIDISNVFEIILRVSVFGTVSPFSHLETACLVTNSFDIFGNILGLHIFHLPLTTIYQKASDSCSNLLLLYFSKCLFALQGKQDWKETC